MTATTLEWEATFSDWTGRPSNAEQDRYEWTLAHVRAALSESSTLTKYRYDVYAKGSYPNLTNVVRDSDVDVAVEVQDFFNYEFANQAAGWTAEAAGIIPYTGPLSLEGFKSDVEQALSLHFGASFVSRGSKSIHVRETTRGLKADVVPCTPHRLYRERAPWSYDVGTRLVDDDYPSKVLINFPKQHLARGTAKNDATHRRYKRVVRILKRLENELVGKDLIEAVPSFLIESAVWNCDEHFFNIESTWSGQVRNVLGHVYVSCVRSEAESSSQWLEANGIKYLFHADQPWTRETVTDFCHLAWNYLGFQ